MNKTTILIVTIGLIFCSCSNDDSGNHVMADPDNQAPESFGLISVADNSTDIQPNPSFSWNTAIDPDGDEVLYDLFLDTKPNPETRVAQSLENTTFKVADSLPLCRARTYYWKVVAKDGRGGETASQTFDFLVRTLNDAEGFSSANPFTARENHASTTLNGMWVIGGFDAKGPSNQVWFSVDGNNWDFVNENGNTDFTRRVFHAAVSFNGALWITGGVGTGFLNDVWTSTDGITWTEVGQVQEYVARAEHTLTVFQDKLWIIGGGGNGGIKLADVWRSSDGALWEQMAINAPFGKRNFHQTVAFKGKLWVIGGLEEDENFNQEAKNDVWSSEDGIDWKLETENPEFSPRFGHQALVFDDKIWLIGRSGDGGVLNDIWYSEDGVEWFDATTRNSFADKAGFTALFYDGKIWILGGDMSNEVWDIDYELGTGE